jgi:hypothetical protein
VKWHLPSGSTAEGEHNGRTSKTPIKDHKACYNFETQVVVRITINKEGHLQDIPLDFRIVHEVSHTEKILLGTLGLNLAQYVDASEQGVEEEGVVRRYLMQDSKINSTIKIGVYLKQIDGDRAFTAPPLTIAPVFSGIAGLVVGEVEDTDGMNPAGSTPALNSKAQVAGDELRELYRRTIAANWTCLPGELSADKVIEDIFNGGDGWQCKTPATGPGNERASDGDGKGTHGHSRKQSSRPNLFFSRNRQDAKRRSKEDLHTRSERPGGVRGRGSFEQQARPMSEEEKLGDLKSANEFDELEIRDDLRSWKMPT